MGGMIYLLPSAYMHTSVRHGPHYVSPSVPKTLPMTTGQGSARATGLHAHWDSYTFPTVSSADISLYTVYLRRAVFSEYWTRRDIDDFGFRPLKRHSGPLHQSI